MKQRIITGIIAAAVFLPIVILGKLPFLVLIYLLGTIGLYELIRMKKLPLNSFASVISFVMLWLILIPESANGILTGSGYDKTQIIIGGVLVLLISTVLSKNRFMFDDAGFLVISVIYIGMGFYYLFETRDTNGLTYVFFALFTIWATDSGAYFIGKSMGKRKLWPEISPNKTIGGFIGGIISALVIAVLFSMFSAIDRTLIELLFMSILIAIFGQLGDLVQSAYKRHYGVKDSGKLLPGHGGILDRLDSLIFILPILHFLQIL